MNVLKPNKTYLQFLELLKLFMHRVLKRGSSEIAPFLRAGPPWASGRHSDSDAFPFHPGIKPI